jgi:hypothetical protein
LIKDQLRLFKGLQEALFLMLRYPNPGCRMMPAGPALGQIRWLSLDVEGCCFASETSSLTSGRFGWLRPRFSSLTAEPLNATYRLRRYLLYQATPTCARAREHNLLTFACYPLDMHLGEGIVKAKTSNHEDTNLPRRIADIARHRNHWEHSQRINASASSAIIGAVTSQ